MLQPARGLTPAPVRAKGLVRVPVQGLASAQERVRVPVRGLASAQERVRTLAPAPVQALEPALGSAQALVLVLA